MFSDQQIPLTLVRGVGPSAASKMTQCGIDTVGQLANMSIAEFKLACPLLEKRAEAFVKGARRLLKRLDLAVGGCVAGEKTLLSDGSSTGDEQLSTAASVTVGESAQVRKRKTSGKDIETAAVIPGQPGKQKKKKKQDGGAKKKEKKLEKEKTKKEKSDIPTSSVKDKKKQSDRKKDAKKSSDKKEKKEKKEKKKKKNRDK